VLLELVIRDLAIIEHLRLQFGPGFSVLTGETGAGKSIIIDGLNLLLGSRADSTLVRAGAVRAEVEGTFALPELPSGLANILDQEQLWGDEPERMVLAREIRANGGSVSRINGRLVNLALLREIGAGLVDVHGQGEHLSLLHVREHLPLLDRYAGLEPSREEMGQLVRQLDDVRSDLQRLRQDERELARRSDLLAYQVEEIRRANLQSGEDTPLRDERTRLANAEQLARTASEAYTYLDGAEADAPSVRDLLATAERALAGIDRIDASQRHLWELAQQISFQVEELIDRVRSYRDQVELNPRRLAAVEERLELLHRLRRKYGDSVDEVLVYADRAAAELEAITHSEEHLAELEAHEAQLLQQIGEKGTALSQQRRQAAARMTAAAEDELNDLQMAGSRLEVNIQWRSDPFGARVSGRDDRVAFDGTGLDRIEFLISPNPGEPLKPMVKIASGGETSRLMLAIKTVLAKADQIPTLVFDEIDQGIGGRVGQIVGQKLRGLCHVDGLRQVICITHLPQLAGFGNHHYRVEKQVQGGRTTTHVRPLETEEQKVAELAQMLGGETTATRQSAREILSQVTSLT
jgi:DNA repair protein RecN (Recombination protein N)